MAVRRRVEGARLWCSSVAQFVEVPPQRLAPSVLQALLEEFASRDGTDYGECELSLVQKAEDLRRQLRCGELALVFDVYGEQWDLIPRHHAWPF